MSNNATLPFAEVIGDPIAQSKSPLIHGFWLDQLGMSARYTSHQVSTESLTDYISARRGNPHWRGCNITMPLKQQVIPLLDRIEPQAEAIGAVNTVYRGESGLLVGANTDVEGFLEPLEGLLSGNHLFRMARILGAGGAARAIVSALAKHNFTFVIGARNQGKGRKLLKELVPTGEHYATPIDHFAQPTDFPFDDREGCLDLVINASPLGMRGQAPLAFDWSHAPPGSIAYDIVTDPVETEFLANAKTAGFATIGGLAMLIGQAAMAFERFFGKQPPREFDNQLLERLQQ